MIPLLVLPCSRDLTVRRNQQSVKSRFNLRAFLGILFVALAILLPCTLPVNAQQAGKPSAAEKDRSTAQVSIRPVDQQWYMGRQIARTMSAAGADWLVRESRAREEHPQKLIKALELKPGQMVCDFGCGNGFYSLQLAPLVGPLGKILAVDIQQEMLDSLRQRAEPRGLRNIEMHLASPTDPKLPAGEIDLLLMIDVYHELSNPAEILGVVHQSLRSQGRLAMVEFREEDPEVPILPLHKMSQSQVIKEITANGFKLVGQYDGLPWQHVLFFARSDSPLPVVPLSRWSPIISPETDLQDISPESPSESAEEDGPKKP